MLELYARTARSRARARSARGSLALTTPRDHLGGDRHGDLVRKPCADVDPERHANPREIARREPLCLEAVPRAHGLRAAPDPADEGSADAEGPLDRPLIERVVMRHDEHRGPRCVAGIDAALPVVELADERPHAFEPSFSPPLFALIDDGHDEADAREERRQRRGDVTAADDEARRHREDRLEEDLHAPAAAHPQLLTELERARLVRRFVGVEERGEVSEDLALDGTAPHRADARAVGAGKELLSGCRRSRPVARGHRGERASHAASGARHSLGERFGCPARGRHERRERDHDGDANSVQRHVRSRVVLTFVAPAFALVLLDACDRRSPKQELDVAAATSLREVMPELARGYEAAHPGIHVVVSYAASGVLRRQIESGDPVDAVFLAGSTPFDALVREGHVDGASRAVIASNVLVLVGTKGSSLRFTTLTDLLPADLIAIGDPRTVPAGEYAESYLRALGSWDALRPALVFGANVSAVLVYARRREATAAIVYRTEVRGVTDLAILDEAEGPLAPHPAVVAGVVRGGNPAAAGLVSYTGGSEARRVFAKYGFGPP